MIQFILEAADATSTSTSPYGNLLFFGPLILIAVGMYFFLIRPQRKKDKELSQQISEMQVGDKIVTIGGFVGEIVNIGEEEVTFSSSVAHTYLTIQRSAIATITKRGAEAVDDGKKKK